VRQARLLKGRTNVVSLQDWVEPEDFLSGLAGREQTQNRTHGYSQAADTGLAAHQCGIVSHAVEEARGGKDTAGRAWASR
jgi:hypothetical protein